MQKYILESNLNLRIKKIKKLKSAFVALWFDLLSFWSV